MGLYFTAVLVLAVIGIIGLLWAGRLTPPPNRDDLFLELIAETLDYYDTVLRESKLHISIQTRKARVARRRPLQRKRGRI